MSSPPEIVSALFGVDASGLAPRWNIAPTQSAAIIRLVTPAQRELAHVRWGLIPPWSKDGPKSRPLINARSETAASKPSFREAMKGHRCLVPADGFYEWKRCGDTKKPFCIRRGDGSPFAMAGLCARWVSPDGVAIESFAILTTTPNKTMAPIHDRMPVIITPAEYDRWLDAEQHDPISVSDLLGPCDDDLLIAAEVSSAVNRPTNDSPACCEPIRQSP